MAIIFLDRLFNARYCFYRDFYRDFIGQGNGALFDQMQRQSIDSAPLCFSLNSPVVPNHILTFH